MTPVSSSIRRRVRDRRATLAASAFLLLPGFLAQGAVAATSFTDPTTGDPLTLAEPAPPSLAGDYLAGLVAGKRGDLGAAADFLLTVQAARPDDTDVLSLAFVAAAAAGRDEAALRLARQVLTLDANNGTAILIVATQSVLDGSWTQAAEQLRPLDGDGITGAARALLTAWVTLPSEGLTAAQMTLEPLGGNSGTALFYHLHRALTADVAGDAASAKTSYDAALASVPRPSLRLALLAGNFFARNGEPARAETLYRTLQADGGGGGLVEPLLADLAAGKVPAPMIPDARAGFAEVLFELAGVLAQQKAEEAALVEAYLALRLKPDFYSVSILLSEILQQQDRSEEVVAVLQAIPPSAPEHWQASYGLAEELYKLKRPEEAIAIYEKMAAERPDDFQPLYLLGNLLRADSRFAESAEAYDRAIARVPNLTQPFWSLLYFRGIAYERSGQWEKAEADLRHALELEPEQPQVMNYLAYSWVEKGENLDEAKAMLTRAVELRPQDGYIVDSLGWALYRMGEYDEAVHYLERAVELSAGQAVINDHLGDAYWMVGRKREARVQWQRALSLLPDPDLDAPAVEAKLDRGLPTQ